MYYVCRLTNVTKRFPADAGVAVWSRMGDGEFGSSFQWVNNSGQDWTGLLASFNGLRWGSNGLCLLFLNPPSRNAKGFGGFYFAC